MLRNVNIADSEDEDTTQILASQVTKRVALMAYKWATRPELTRRES